MVDLEQNVVTIALEQWYAYAECRKEFWCWLSYDSVLSQKLGAGFGL